MIANEREYRTTKRWVDRFEQARVAVDTEQAHLPDRARQAFRDQYDSQIDELRAQIAEYEALRDGRVRMIELETLDRLPEVLIHARIASGLTQKAFGERVGLKEQQIQQYE